MVPGPPASALPGNLFEKQTTGSETLGVGLDYLCLASPPSLRTSALPLYRQPLGDLIKIVGPRVGQKRVQISAPPHPSPMIWRLKSRILAFLAF